LRSEPLNLFLKQTARQHASAESRARFLVDENAARQKPIMVFRAEYLPDKIGNAYARTGKKIAADVSAVRLGRLARAIGFKGQGIGEILLIAAMEKFIEIFNRLVGLAFRRCKRSKKLKVL